MVCGLLRPPTMHGAVACMRSFPMLLAGMVHRPQMCATNPRQIVTYYEEVRITSSSAGPPAQKITVTDLTPYVSKAIANTAVRDGTVTLISKHTTTGITINEWESRLAVDLCDWLLRLAPPDERSIIGENSGVRYLHNDIDQRPDGADERQRCFENGWNVDDAAVLQMWRDQEPINAHSHLAAILLGSSESIPIVDGSTVLGQWQSALLVDLDGPRMPASCTLMTAQ